MLMVMRTYLQVLFIQPGSFQDLFVRIFSSSSSSTAFHAYERSGLHGVHCCDCVSATGQLMLCDGL